MTDRTVILVPRRRDHGHRDRLWTFARSVWAELFPDWPIVEGHHDRGPYNRSAAVNRAADLAGAWDLAVIIDADVLPDPDGITAALNVARTGRPASGFDRRNNLNSGGTKAILGGYRGSWQRHIGSVHERCISGAFAVGRELWDEVGGFDELFVGWGFEDTAFEIATETVAGAELYRAPAVLWHLWHPKSPEHDHRLPGFRANRARRELYTAARGDLEALTPLLDEARAARAGQRSAPPAASVAQRTIPRILHRTVPANPSEEAETFWRDAGDLHPGWQLLDHRDPLDPADWPETSDLWPRCTSGAQRAGLIRLEALWRWGGIYIDSDVELYRSLEPLTALDGFAGWEDDRCCPDAVLGFRAGHPAVALMLELARARLLEGRGAWDTGPGVTTTILPGRPDVLLLPPGAFYPYHYTERHRRAEDHAHPYTFGAHHWAHSWRGR